MATAAGAPVAVQISAQYDGVSQLATGTTFENNTLSSGDPTAIANAEAYLASATTYANQFTYGWGTGNPEPMPGVFNWGSLDTRVRLMEAMHVQPVLTLVSSPDWMTVSAQPPNTNTISAVPAPGADLPVTLAVPLAGTKGGTSIIGGDTILVDTGDNAEQVFVSSQISSNGQVTGFRATFTKAHASGTAITWGYSDFKEYPPTEDHFQDFANLATAMAQRYPDVLHYQVWSELRGLWVDSNCVYSNQNGLHSPNCASEPGVLNNWDYVAYTKLYNMVYDALKSVNPNIQVGGPYIPIRAHPHTGPVQLYASENTAIRYWLSHAHGADFIDFDHSIVYYHDADAGAQPPGGWTLDQILAQTNTAEDITNQIRALTNAPDMPSWAHGLPIWWSEDYFDARTDRVGYAPEAFQEAALTSLLLHEIRSGAAAEFRWKPETDKNIGYSGEQESFFSDTRDSVTPGRFYPYATAFKTIHDYFGPGTQLRAVTSSSPTVEALASDQKTILINKTGQVVPVLLNGVALTLQPYETRIQDTPALWSDSLRASLLTNGGFEGALTPWILNVKSPAAASVSQDTSTYLDGASSACVMIGVATPGNPYNAQLTERNVAVTAGTTYTLTFAAKASQSRQIDVTLQQNATPYAVYAHVAAIPVTTDWQQFTYTFRAPATDTASALRWNLSGAAGKVWLDDVAITATGSP